MRIVDERLLENILRHNLSILIDDRRSDERAYEQADRSLAVHENSRTLTIAIRGRNAKIVATQIVDDSLACRLEKRFFETLENRRLARTFGAPLTNPIAIENRHFHLLGRLAAHIAEFVGRRRFRHAVYILVGRLVAACSARARNCWRPPRLVFTLTRHVEPHHVDAHRRAAAGRKNGVAALMRGVEADAKIGRRHDERLAAFTSLDFYVRPFGACELQKIWPLSLQPPSA